MSDLIRFLAANKSMCSMPSGKSLSSFPNWSRLPNLFFNPFPPPPPCFAADGSLGSSTPYKLLSGLVKRLDPSASKSADINTCPDLTPLSGYHPGGTIPLLITSSTSRMAEPKDLSLPNLSASNRSILIVLSPPSGTLKSAS